MNKKLFLYGCIVLAAGSTVHRTIYSAATKNAYQLYMDLNDALNSKDKKASDRALTIVKNENFDANIDPLTEPKNYAPPLMLVVKSPLANLNLIDALLKGGANINYKNKENETPLIALIKNEKIGSSMLKTTLIGRLTVDKNLDIEQKDDAQKTAWDYAKEMGLKGMTIDKIKPKQASTTTPKDLYNAAEVNNAELVRTLLAAAVDPNALTNNMTPLMIAAKNKLANIVDILLEKSSVNMRNNNDQTALHVAANIKDDNGRVIKKLLDANIDVNAQDNNGDTALMLAVLQKNLSNIQALLKSSNIDLAIKNNEDGKGKWQNALWIALGADEPDTQILHALLVKDKEKNSGIVNSRDNNNKTPLDEVATKKNKDNLTGMFVNFNAKTSEQLDKKADEPGTPDLTKLQSLAAKIQSNNSIFDEDIKEINPYINTLIPTDESLPGWASPFTLLMMAAKKNNLDVAKKLIDSGANVDIQNKRGTTALMQAMETPLDRKEIIQLLIDHSNNINLKNSKGQTALDLLTTNLAGMGKIVELLISKSNPEALKQALEALSKKYQDDDVKKAQKMIEDRLAAKDGGPVGPGAPDLKTIAQKMSAFSFSLDQLTAYINAFKK